MIGGVGFGVVALLVALLTRHGTWLMAHGTAAVGTWPLAVPLAALWIASPAIARWASLPPPVAGGIAVSAADARTLRLIARRTWRYFETFVTAADNMLPPDNFQEDPAPALAHRTSPTNLGLYLLSTATARDFAWVGTTEAAERLDATLSAMGRLARFRGHFFNWYDTKDLRPLDPPYVSTVDSGNLAGHLIALANACHEWAVGMPGSVQRLGGIADALDLAREAIDLLRDGRRTQTATWQQLDHALTALAAGMRQPARNDGDLAARLADLAAQAEIVADIATAFASERGDDTGADMLFWLAAARRSIDSHRRDIDASPDAAAALATRLAALETTARGMALEMGYGFLLDPDRKLLSIGYRVQDGDPRPKLLRSAGVRGAACELHRHRQGRRPGAPLVPSRPCGYAHRQWRRADFLVGLDVRIPDAVAGDARAGRQPAGANQPADRAAADRLWQIAGPALGRFGIRLQHPRPGVHLPILQFRRSRARPEARPG